MQTPPTLRHACAEAADLHAQTCLLVMCGLPAAGKSSIAEHLRGRPPGKLLFHCCLKLSQIRKRQQ